MMDQTIVQSFSRKVKKLWNGWEIRGLVLLSLSIQVILILLGSQRKKRRHSLMKATVWASYMAADWVATIGMGNLAKIQIEDYGKNTLSNKRFILQGFWAPFLLLHLGGPDTITAYSLEDNELWLRHFLALFVETSVSAYVLVRSWTGTYVSFVAIVVLVIGFFKYGERTYVLWSASTKRFKENFLASMETRSQESTQTHWKETCGEEPKQSQSCLIQADTLFNKFQYLFANLILSKNDRNECYNIIAEKSPEEAFKLVAIELGFLYDVLYTKATLLYSPLGICLRFIIFVSTVTALVVFSVFVDVYVYHDPTDITVTYLLLGGAACLEVIAFFNFVLSDRTMLWLVKHQTLLKIPSCVLNRVLNRKRWLKSMAQYNLLDFCLKEKNCMVRFIVNKLRYVGKMLEEYLNSSRRDVTVNVMEAIYKHLKAKGEKISKDCYNTKAVKDLLDQRGDGVLAENFRKDEAEIFKWYTIYIEFDHSLLVWHIATDILYHIDFDQRQTDQNLLTKRNISKCLSNYMLYLLVVCPAMLPQGIGEIRYRDTCAQVTRFYKRLQEPEKSKAKEKQVFCNLLCSKIGRRPANQSVLSDGCELAKKLKILGYEKRWEIIGEVWIEMLAYVASHCGWREHAQQLWKGGELLTHVSVLMTHLGISGQYTEKERF